MNSVFSGVISGGGGGGETVYVDVSELTFSVTQAAHGLAVKDVVRWNGTAWVKAQANASNTLGQAIVKTVPTVDTCTLIYLNNTEVTFTAHGEGSAGATLYLSEAAAGDLKNTVPASGYAQQIAMVKDANTLILQDYPAKAV